MFTSSHAEYENENNSHINNDGGDNDNDQYKNVSDSYKTNDNYTNSNLNKNTFTAALEQSRLLPLPVKILLQQVRDTLQNKVPFTTRSCKKEIRRLTALAIKITDSGFFERSDVLKSILEHLHIADTSADQNSIFGVNFKKWKQGREKVKAAKSLLAEILRPFARYAVNWPSDKRGQSHKFGLRTGSDGSFYQGEWDSASGLRNGVGVEVSPHIHIHMHKIYLFTYTKVTILTVLKKKSVSTCHCFHHNYYMYIVDLSFYV